MEKSFRKDVLEKCWSCGEGIDKDDNCFCDRQSLKIRDLSERIKELEAERYRLRERETFKVLVILVGGGGGGGSVTGVDSYGGGVGICKDKFR